MNLVPLNVVVLIESDRLAANKLQLFLCAYHMHGTGATGVYYCHTRLYSCMGNTITNKPSPKFQILPYFY